VAALEAFRAGKVDLLVATDIAARGLDVQGISHVVNYDIPRHAEDYVHRIGRTARAGEKGVAVSLVTREDRESVLAIERLIGLKLRGKGEEQEERPAARSAQPAARSGQAEGRSRQPESRSGEQRRRPASGSRRQPARSGSGSERRPRTAPARTTSGFGESPRALVEARSLVDTGSRGGSSRGGSRGRQEGRRSAQSRPSRSSDRVAEPSGREGLWKRVFNRLGLQPQN
jgi:superfamily II DNA/RNA helicase